LTESETNLRIVYDDRYQFDGLLTFFLRTQTSLSKLTHNQREMIFV